MDGHTPMFALFDLLCRASHLGLHIVGMKARIGRIVCPLVPTIATQQRIPGRSGSRHEVDIRKRTRPRGAVLFGRIQLQTKPTELKTDMQFYSLSKESNEEPVRRRFKAFHFGMRLNPRNDASRSGGAKFPEVQIDTGRYDTILVDILE